MVSSSDCCNPLLCHHAWFSVGQQPFPSSAYNSPWSCCDGFKFWAMNLLWFRWLHDRWFVRLVLANGTNNGQVVLEELLSQRDTGEKVVPCDFLTYGERIVNLFNIKFSTPKSVALDFIFNSTIFLIKEWNKNKIHIKVWGKYVGIVLNVYMNF